MSSIRLFLKDISASISPITSAPPHRNFLFRCSREGDEPGVKLGEWVCLLMRICPVIANLSCHRKFVLSIRLFPCHPERREGSQCNGGVIVVEKRRWERFLSPFEMTRGGDCGLCPAIADYVLSSRNLSCQFDYFPVIPNGERDHNAMA